MEEKLGELEKSSPTVDEVALLRKELEQLKVRVGEASACKNETIFTCELKGVKALLARSEEERTSNFFYCGGELEIFKGRLIHLKCLTAPSFPIETLELIFSFSTFCRHSLVSCCQYLCGGWNKMPWHFSESREHRRRLECYGDVRSANSEFDSPFT